MCGIFGYVGTKNATPFLVEGLRTLEYRGYDSAGMYLPAVGLIKAVGPINNLAAKVDLSAVGTAGIAHTRWATHGPPTEVNAHPHADATGTVYLVHNGIIENYREIKELLKKEGHIFVSETDTEVLAHLIGKLYTTETTLTDAVLRALLEVRGAYGIAVMSSREPEVIVVARMGSPIVIGVSDYGNFVSSDPAALLPHTKEVVYLNDGDIATLTSTSYDIVTLSEEKPTRTPERIEGTLEAVQKMGHEHFMMKEIMEGPEVLKSSARGRLIPQEGLAKLGGLESVAHELARVDRITIVGCGSAYYAGLVGKYMLEEYTGIPVDCELGSELRYSKKTLTGNTALLAISQSGETADTLVPIREAKKNGVLTLGIVNVVGSSIARETDAGIYNHAGPEIGVASTKAFISQLEVLALLTLFLGRQRSLSRSEGIAIAEAILVLPEHLTQVLTQKDAIKAIAQKYASMKNALYIGRKFHLPIALEGALKLKEVSYVHAEGYGAGEMKHGPIAMIDKNFPTIAIAPQNSVYEKMVSNMEEIRARSGPLIVVATEGDEAMKELTSDIIYIPKTHDILTPILATVPLQLFAYYMGTEKGYNVDRPRNLAKAVTVE